MMQFARLLMLSLQKIKTYIYCGEGTGEFNREFKSDCRLPSSNPRQTFKNRFRLYFQVSEGNVSQELPYSWFDQITVYNGENLNYQTRPKNRL